MEKRIQEGFPRQRLTFFPQKVKRRCRSLPVVQDLHVTDIGHYPSANYHYIERSDGLSETILIYCTSGAGWCKIDGECHTLSEGWALLIPSSVPHVYGSDDDTPWSIYWCHFDGERVRDYRDMLGLSRKQPLLYVPDVQLILEVFEEMHSYVNEDYTDDSLVGLSTTLVHLLGLLRCHQRAPDVQGRRREDKILQSIKYMRKHLDEPCRLDDLAEIAQMSTSHYSHLFKEQTNTSPIQFFIRLKMQRACKLLDTTDQAVQDIAEAVGYDNPFHFSQMFKKVTGKSPTAYRNGCVNYVPKG